MGQELYREGHKGKEMHFLPNGQVIGVPSHLERVDTMRERARFARMHFSQDQDSPTPEDFPQNTSEQPQRKRGNIIVSYDGVLAEELLWDARKLARITNRFNLKTEVTIKNSSETSETDYSNLGEVAVLKKIVDVNGNFGSQREVGHYRINQQEAAGRATIFIKDQEIRQEIMDKNDNVWNPNKFVNAVNKAALQGVSDIVTWEKVKQLREGLLYSTQNIVYYAVLGVVGYIGAKLVYDGFLDAVKIIAGEENELKGLVEYFKIVIGSLLLMTIARPVLDETFSIAAEHMPNKIRPEAEDPYIAGLSDFNPLKHMYDLTKGSIYSEIAARKIVRLQK
jgi:hypothetical protein